MKTGNVLSTLCGRGNRGEKSYWILLDPDHFSADDAQEAAAAAQEAGAHAVLVGGSLIHSNHFDPFVASIKKRVDIPVILFPGDATQLSPHADALLFLSLVSGRNPVNLIGEHVKAAPRIKEYGLEAISTAYMLVESGGVSSVEFMSNTRPLPRRKTAIAAAHALAAQYIGMKLVYLEAGSGARDPVPDEMIAGVKALVDMPVIVGGGIRDEATAAAKLTAGADIIVTGNMLQKRGGLQTMKKIAKAVSSVTA